MNDENVWHPIHWIVEWTYNFIDTISVVILLPSGVSWDGANDVTTKVEADGHELVVTLKWPPFMRTVASMNWRFANEAKKKGRPEDFPSCHPRLLAFELHLSDHLNADDTMVSVARIKLATPVSDRNQDVSVWHVGNNKGARALYVDLIARTTANYRIRVKKEAKFEISDDADEDKVTK